MSVTVGVAAVVIRQGSILLVQRQGSHGSGTWGLPGGTQERDEHPYETARREALEETGVAVVPKCSWGPGWTSGAFRDGGSYGTTVWVQCTFAAGVARVTEPDKATAVRWVPLGQLQDLKPLFHPLLEVVRAGWFRTAA